MPAGDTGRHADSASTLRVEEYASLRNVIASRGTARMVVAPLSVSIWAGLALGSLIWGMSPIVALVLLAPLVAGFEAVHALHAGVERIGRYIQVSYESAEDGPRWETAALRVGPALPGGGIDPLFSVLFTASAALNLLVAGLSAPSWPLFSVLAAAHAAFVFRMVRARTAAARQRAVELESFRAVLSAGHRAV